MVTVLVCRYTLSGHERQCVIGKPRPWETGSFVSPRGILPLAKPQFPSSVNEERDITGLCLPGLG